MLAYLAERERLIETAVPGIASARRLSRLTDEALAELAEEASALLGRRTRWALIALGGYGTGNLLPASDIDLLVVSDSRGEAIQPFVERILYPLWDAGLVVGHQVRSRKDQVRAIREDVATLTSTLTGRVLAGDDRLGLEVLRQCAADARRRSSAVLGELRSRERPGSPYLLEPDLKEGAGGRRDLDEFTWTSAVLTGAPQSDPSALVSLGAITAQELALLESAADHIAAARWEVQAADGGQILSLEFAEEMRTDATGLQRSLADTHHLLLQMRERLVSREASAKRGAERVALSAGELISLALEGGTSIERLQEVAWSGGMEALVPGMKDLMVLRRPGLSHTLTVGAHCLTAATKVGDIVQGAVPDDLLGRSAAVLHDPRPVVVAALVHDAGKEIPGPGHAERGAPTAARAAQAMGIDDSDHVAALVRHHLLLAEAAAAEDLDDEDSVLRVAELLGDRDLVAPLHVLTVADSLATGPAAWSQWHAALLGKLVARLDAALSPQVDGAGLTQQADAVRTQALGLLPEDSPLRSLLEHAPSRFLALRSAEEALRHTGLAAEILANPAPDAKAIDITIGPLVGSYRVTIAATDRHGLFATLAGVFALSGLDILSAEVGSGPRGVALDTFTVRSATLAQVDQENWSRFERLLGQALKNQLSLGVRLSERQRHYRPGRATRPSKIALSTDDPFAAVLKVRAPDKVGLLHEITKAIADSGLDIISATILTKGDMAEDTFRLVDGSGEAPSEAGLLGQLRMRLRDVV